MPRFTGEIERIRSAYQRYDQEESRQRAWDAQHPSNRLIFDERARCLERMLRKRGFWPMGWLRVIDLGCGSGHLLRWLIARAGLEPSNAVGVDLLSSRTKHAQESLPNSVIVGASADTLPFPDATFDIAFAFTLFSSLLQEEFRAAVAKEIQRVLAADGLFVCYDFRYPNPWNRNTRPVTKSGLKRLFPGWIGESKTLTLLPPLCSRLAGPPMGQTICRALAWIPFLRSHRLTCKRPLMVRERGDLRIGWLCSQEKIERNRAATQRLLFASRRYIVHLYGRGGQEFDPEILRRVRFHQTPLVHNLYMSHALFYAHAFLGILRLSLPKQVQAIYTTVDYSAIVGFALRTLAGVRWIVDVLDDPSLELQTMTNHRPRLKYGLYWIYCRILRALLRYADAVPAIGTTLTEGLPETLTHSYHVSPERVIPISNGVDLSQTIGSPNRRMPDRFMLLYLGGIAWVRGLDTLIQAAALLQPRIPSLVVCLVGPYRQQEDFDQLNREIDRLDLRSVIHLVGKAPHDEALDWMASADVCAVVLNPRIKNFRYTFSVKLFEYLAVGRAVAAPDLPGVRYVIRHESNGLLYRPADPKDLADTVYRLYTEPDLRRRLETAARPSVEGYDWEKVNARLFGEIEARIGVSSNGSIPTS